MRRMSGNGGGGALSTTAIARALAAKGLTDAQARAAIGGAATLSAGLIAAGLLKAASAPAPTPAPAPPPEVSGLLYKSNGSLAGWTGNDGSWSTLVSPALIPFARSPIVAVAPGAPGSSHAGGVREGFPFVDADGTFYIFYGAGNGSETDAGGPWRPQYSKSADRGLTWAHMGEVPGIGLRHGYDAGSWAARDMLFVRKVGAAYQFHTLTAATVARNQICGQSYTSDVWQAASIEGPYSFVRRTLESGPAGRFDALDAYSSSLAINADGSLATDANGLFQLFYSATRASGSEWYVGRATSSDPAGPFTTVPVQVLPDAIRGQDENPEVFRHPTLDMWVMTTNIVNKALNGTDRNKVYFSSSVTDWTQARSNDLQRISPMDGPRAVGHMRPIRDATNRVLIDGLGNVPAIYDTDPTDPVSGHHTGRSLRYSVLEPSAYAMLVRLASSGGSYAEAYATGFDALTPGDLGGQDGWIDGSGANAKPQVTAGGKLDMRSSVGPSLVYRTGTYTDIRQSFVGTFSTDTGVGLAFGYTPGAAHFRIDHSVNNNSLFSVVTYVGASGGETNLQISNSGDAVPVNQPVPISVTVRGDTITIVAGGLVVATYTEIDPARRSVLAQAGGVAIRNGNGGTGQRIVDDYRIETRTETTGIVTGAPVYLSRPHGEFVADFAIMANGAGGTINLFYRLQGASSLSDGYRIALDMSGAGPVAASAAKLVSGTAAAQNGATATRTIKAVRKLHHRLTVSVQGAAHTVSVDGEVQLSFNDAAFPTGVALALQGVSPDGMDAEVRPYAIRKSNTVTVGGVTAGQVVTLRAAGGIPLASVTATGASVTLTAPHYPATSIDVGGVQRHAPVGGIWGGDSYG